MRDSGLSTVHNLDMSQRLEEGRLERRRAKKLSAC